MEKTKQIITYIILMTFPIMSLVTYFDKIVFNTALSDLFVILLCLFWVIDFKHLNFKKRFKYCWYFALMVLITLVSNLVARQIPGIVTGGLTVYISEALKFVIVAIYFYVGLNSFKEKKQFKNILIFWMIGLWFNIIVGILTQVKYLMGDKIDWHTTLGAEHRFLGGLTDPNMAGTYLSLSFFIVLLFVKMTQNKKMKLFGIVTMAFTVICIVLTGSRGTFAGFGVALFLYVILNIKRLYKVCILVIPLAIILYLGFVDFDYTVLDNSLSQQIVNRIEGSFEESGTYFIRKNLTIASLQMAADYPFFGVGRGNFRDNATPYLEKIYEQSGQTFSSRELIPHNTLVGIFAEMGFIGLITFCSIFIILFLKVRKKRNGINSVFVFALLAFFIQSIALNLENFRGFWIILGMFFALQEADISQVEDDVYVLDNKKTMAIYAISSLLLCGILYFDVGRKVPSWVHLKEDGQYKAYIHQVDSGVELNVHFTLEGQNSKSASKIEIYEIEDEDKILIEEYWHKYPDGQGFITLNPSDDTDGYEVGLSAMDHNQVTVKELYYSVDEKSKPLLTYKFVPDTVRDFLNANALLEYRKPEVIEILSNDLPINIEDDFTILSSKTEKRDGGQYVTVRFKALRAMEEDYKMTLKVHSDNINNIPYLYRARNFYEMGGAIYPQTSTWEVGEEYEYVLAFKGEDTDYQVSAYISGFADKEFYIGELNPESVRLDDYLDAIKPDQLVIISLYNEGTRALEPLIIKSLNMLGLKADLMGKYGWSYIGICGNIKGLEPMELISEGEVNVELTEADRLGEFTIPFHLSVLSAGLNAGNASSIIIDEQEYSKRGRGLNIVVYDLSKKEIVESTSFDTYKWIYR